MVSTLVALSALAAYHVQFPLPSLRIPDGWGVNIHFTDPRPGEVAKIAAAGFRWVRMDFFWAGIEKTPGVYDFSAFDRLMASLDANHIRPVFILDYGNDFYQKGSPRTPESRAAFCRFVAAGLRHFRHRGILWEMWNEPNIQFWSPKPDVEEYVALARQVGQTIRRTAPDEWFVGPATSGFAWDFLQKCFDSGLLSYWDAVSVHPYRGEPPETVSADWRRLRGLIDGAAPAGKAIPMLSGEWGYSTTGVSEQTQADYIVRQYLSNLASGVPLSIWYDWKDDGPDPKEPEHHFGAVHQDTSPKPAYLAAQRLSRFLDGYTIEHRWEGPATVMQFRKGSERRTVAWASDGQTTSSGSLARTSSLAPPRSTSRAGSSAQHRRVQLLADAPIGQRASFFLPAPPTIGSADGVLLLRVRVSFIGAGIVGNIRGGTPGR